MPAGAGRTGNLLLDALPHEELVRLIDEEPARTLNVHEIVQAADAPIRSVHFPIAGMLSVVTSLDGGAKRVESGTIGREGMSNVLAAVGSGRSVGQETVVQVQGEAFAVPAERLGAEIDRGGRLRRILYGYAQAFWSQSAHIAACNAVHSVTHRCARWLLQTHDRVGADFFFLTQEYLAGMLGVERSTVSVAAVELHRRGVIDYARGRIEIVDRNGLEAAACECYALIRSAYATLVPFSEGG